MNKHFVTLLISTWVAGCSLCDNRAVRSLQSPDDNRSAVMFMRECGATTDFTTQVSVLSPWWPYYAIGNAFVADADQGKAERASWGGPWADISWQSSTHLVITYDARSRVFKKKTEVRGIRITYRPVRR